MDDFFSALCSVKGMADTLMKYGLSHPMQRHQSLTPDDSQSFQHALLQRKKTATRITHLIKERKFVFQPARLIKLVSPSGKVRFSHQFCIQDQIVMKRMAELCMPALMKMISPSVFSYLPQRNHLQAIQHISHYLRHHRDVYLLRTDITQYTDSIDVTENALLWEMLKGFLRQIGSKNESSNNYLLDLFKSALRPIILEESGSSYQQSKGIALGIPLTPIIANLYLASLDELLSSNTIENYLRFGDDIVLADTNKARLLRGEEILAEEVQRLGLTRQAKKDQFFWLNRAGRKESGDGFIGAIKFDYLGASIFANGDVALTKEKQSQFLSDLSSRLYNLQEALKGQPDAVKGVTICEAISNGFLFSPVELRQINSLLRIVTHQAQLKQLDYLMARFIAEKISGASGARAFRYVSYRQLRSWGLRSLYYERFKASKERG